MASASSAPLGEISVPDNPTNLDTKVKIESN
jgi:hypothetical protein